MLTDSPAEEAQGQAAEGSPAASAGDESPCVCPGSFLPHTHAEKGSAHGLAARCTAVLMHLLSELLCTRRLVLHPAWVRGVGRRVARCQPARGESHCSPFSLLGHCGVPGGGSPLHPAQLARTLAPSTPTVPSCSGCSTWSRVVTQPNLHPCSGKAPVSHQ